MTKIITYDQIRKSLKARGVDDQTIEAFIKEYISNPDVWVEFQKITFRLIAEGKEAGAKSIMEKIRWDTSVENKKRWKCNNSFTAYYGHVFGEKYPEYQDYFEKRELKGLKAA